MKIHYDKKSDSIYIELTKGKYSQSKKITDDILVDEDKYGKIIGIEILDAKENITAFDPKKTSLTFAN